MGAKENSAKILYQRVTTNYNTSPFSLGEVMEAVRRIKIERCWGGNEVYKDLNPENLANVKDLYNK